MTTIKPMEAKPRPEVGIEQPNASKRPQADQLESDTASPGVLRGAARLTVHTHQALRLVKGRAGTTKKPAIIGLLGFARLLRPIWEGVRAGDPYADCWILKVQEALDRAEHVLLDEYRELDRCVTQISTIHIEPAASVKPFSMRLQFTNPYAFRGARLLANYDALVRGIRTAAHMGLLTRVEAERALQRPGRCLRRAFTSPIGYHRLGITRTDVEMQTTKALRACELMGTVPEDILMRTRYGNYGFLPVKTRTPVAEQAENSSYKSSEDA